MEVYTGAKPGRPVLALVMTAVSLVLVLGLAWVQLSNRRALQDETVINGTPLVVRPPKDWLRNEQAPGKFFLPAPSGRQWRGVPFSKQITFEYRRLPEFISPVTYERSAPSRLAGLPAVQTRLPDEEQTHRHAASNAIERVAVSPRGDVIRVELQTLTGVTMADLALLNVVAEAVRVETGGLGVAPAEALARAGVTASVDDDWTAALPEYDEVAACYFGGGIEGMPVWSVAILRSWLAHQRTLVNLLEDYAARHWGRTPREISIETFARDDGLTVAHLRPLGRHQQSIAAVWAVAGADSEVAMMPVYANFDVAIVAGDKAAEKLARTMEFTGPGNVPALDEALRVGRELVETVQQKGALPWWGRQVSRSCFLGDTPRGAETWVMSRRPIADDPQRGYIGFVVNRYASGLNVSRWMLGPHARTYVDIEETSVQLALGPTRVQRYAKGKRPAPDGDVTHLVNDEGNQTQSGFSPGPAFLPSAALGIAEYLVAAGRSDTCIIESAQLRGRGAYTMLLRRLPPDDAGRLRVMLQDDLSPTPSIYAYDEDAELQAVDYPYAKIRRVSEDEVVKRFRTPRGVEAWPTREDLR